MEQSKLKNIKMGLLYCMIGLIIGYFIGIKHQSNKKSIEITKVSNWDSQFLATQKQFSEDRAAYLYLLSIKQDPHLGPLWLDWLLFPYKIYSEKDAWFLRGMNNDDVILKKMDDYKNRWK